MDGHPRVFVKRLLVRFVGPFCRFRWLSGSFTGYIAEVLFTRLSRFALCASRLLRNIAFSRTIRRIVAGSRFSLSWIMNSSLILKIDESRSLQKIDIYCRNNICLLSGSSKLSSETYNHKSLKTISNTRVIFKFCNVILINFLFALQSLGK